MESSPNSLDSQDQSLMLAVPTRGRIRRRNASLPADRRRGWMRGKGYVRGETIFLPIQSQRFYSTTSEEFDNEAQNDAIFTFLQISIDNPDEIEDFVARFGLLTEDGLRDGQEPLESWDAFQGQLIACMELYWAIQEVLKGDKGKEGGLEVLYDAHRYKLKVAHAHVGQPGFEWANLYIEAAEKGHYGRPNLMLPNDFQRRNLACDAYLMLAEILDSLVETVYHRFSFDIFPYKARKNAVQIGPVGFLSSGPESADLKGYLVAQLGYFMQDTRSVHLCKCGCGRFYAPKRADQEYYLPSCGTHARVTKHRKSKAKTKSQGTVSNLET